MHPEIKIRDSATGAVVWSKTLDIDPEKKGGRVAYSANTIGTGDLVYGHFGRFEDLTVLARVLNFSRAVVVLRMSRDYDVASMVRNAEVFGAKAVVLFPDVTMLNEKGNC